MNKLMTVAQYAFACKVSIIAIRHRIKRGEVSTTKDPKGKYKYQLIDTKKFPPLPAQKRGPKTYLG